MPPGLRNEKTALLAGFTETTRYWQTRAPGLVPRYFLPREGLPSRDEELRPGRNPVGPSSFSSEDYETCDNIKRTVVKQVHGPLDDGTRAPELFL